jgi:hypothetical protein
MHTKKSICALSVLGWAWTCLWLGPAAHAYVDMAPTLAKIVTDSKGITLVEVTEFDRAKHVVCLKAVRGLKGDVPADPIQHDVVPADGGAIPRQIQQWAGPGARGVLFVSRNTALVCMGQGWYQAKAAQGGPWKLGVNRPDLPLAYYGAVSRLAEGIELMLAGKDAIITVVTHNADEAASFDLALNRFSLPGLIKPQRLRANLKMPSAVMAVAGAGTYLVGEGAVSEDDMPALAARLRSPDASVRAETAEDLRGLGPKAKAASSALGGLLNDASSSVRLSAASALLAVSGPDSKAVDVLGQGLASDLSTVRRDAAVACGLAGTPVAGLVERLGTLLKDPDESVRIASLQAIATLGPVAAKAASAAVPLLDDSQMAIDAADALGRIGPAAAPVPKALVTMLSSDQAAVRWAAVRAMAQIGGQEAHPAVEFIIRVLPDATEVDGYNMMVYLALLGPVAADAVPALQRVPIKNPFLPSAVRWAIQSDKTLPWLAGGEGRGGFGMPPMGMAGRGGGPGKVDAAGSFYETMVREMGQRLRPTARLMVQKIMEGTAGEVPDWGYSILACAADESVNSLAAHLTDAEQVMRERATVALGYMGPAAATAKDRVAAAIAKVPSDREGRLMRWCLREISIE